MKTLKKILKFVGLAIAFLFALLVAYAMGWLHPEWPSDMELGVFMLVAYAYYSLGNYDKKMRDMESRISALELLRKFP